MSARVCVGVRVEGGLVCVCGCVCMRVSEFACFSVVYASANGGARALRVFLSVCKSIGLGQCVCVRLCANMSAN